MEIDSICIQLHIRRSNLVTVLCYFFFYRFFFLPSARGGRDRGLKFLSRSRGEAGEARLRDRPLGRGEQKTAGMSAALMRFTCDGVSVGHANEMSE